MRAQARLRVQFERMLNCTGGIRELNLRLINGKTAQIGQMTAQIGQRKIGLPRALRRTDHLPLSRGRLFGFKAEVIERQRADHRAGVNQAAPERQRHPQRLQPGAILAQLHLVQHQLRPIRRELNINLRERNRCAPSLRQPRGQICPMIVHIRQGQPQPTE